MCVKKKLLWINTIFLKKNFIPINKQYTELAVLMSYVQRVFLVLVFRGFFVEFIVFVVFVVVFGFCFVWVFLVVFGFFISILDIS